MIVTELYKGQGLGNQLWCYVTTRVIALNKGYDFGIKSPENFKGLDFMNLDFGKQVFGGNSPEGGAPKTLPEGILHYYQEWKITHPDGSDIRTTDEKLINIPDNTKIDGLMQDVKFIIPRKKEIKDWLKIDEKYEFRDFSNNNICVINFRGGGYTKDKNFFLPKNYWENAVANMLKINKDFKFIVITDDVFTAKKFFPEYEVYHFNIAKDYVIIKNAKYLILSNSSFAWFPAWLSEDLKYCIAPKYWGRYNISDGYWSLGYNITPGWIYQDREGNLQDYDSCVRELSEYTKNNKERFLTESNFDPEKKYVPEISKGILAPTFLKRIQGKLRRMKVEIYNKSRNTNILSALFSFGNSEIKQIYSTINQRAETFLNEHNGFLLEIFRRIKNIIKRLISKIVSLSHIPSLIGDIVEYRAKRNWLSEEQIKEYRKKIKIYDIFTFFNELDLLEIRLNILDPYVDYFVIVEATETFSGHPKPLYYELNKERFKKWHEKIIYYATKDTPKNEDGLRSRLHENANLNALDKQIIKDSITSDSINRGATHWFKEFYQKEMIKKALTGLRDDDICYISDLDEIWNPNLLIDYSKNDVFKPIQIGYQYYLNNRTDENYWHGWTGTIVTKYKNIKDSCLNHLRTHRKMESKYIFLKNGGWHFAFLGGYEGAKKKIDEYKHPWYNATLTDLKTKILNNQSHKAKDIKIWKDESGLPAYLLNNKQKYSKLFK